PFTAYSFGSQFAEVRVKPDTGQTRVTRVVAVVDAGRILNQLTARSQIQGGIVWGIGMALLERTEWDRALGAPVTRNLADYLVPANADVPDITVAFTDHPDEQFNSLGVRGIGEIGITGITAAIANAIYHASGSRVRDLPITLDKILS
ncbi:MAG TPA: molybdopterin cofactor-binding domain-containing protein, partial [Opitutaceae bacterium]